jgi:aldehyde dehydrogenase (NAD+)
MLPSSTLNALGLRAECPGVLCGDHLERGSGTPLVVRSPIDGSELASAGTATLAEAEHTIARAHEAFLDFRAIPAPVRGEFVRQFGQLLREHKQQLGALVTREVGKTTQEGEGEVQEMIDICDFAVGLSRQLHGKVIASERPLHRLSEQWHPLGPIGVISAFNFPVAVWAWNAALAWVCGDPVVWKPSEKAPLCAVACHHLAVRAASQVSGIPTNVSSVLLGGREVGEALAVSRKLPLISATGSVRMGRQVGVAVAQRLGRSLLELGGNNAAIVAPSADLELALRAIVFAAVGTSGQRCTTLRRLIVHRSIRDPLVERIQKAYSTLRIGDPRAPGTLMGPLIDEAAFDAMQAALNTARQQGGQITGGERVTSGVPDGGVYVRPALVQFKQPVPVIEEETFAPILYAMPYRDLEQAIHYNNAVPQGLSSSIFTNDVREAERFCSAAGSDCGIVNVNIGTSGAEIGGAFGGEKDTGGGRESGSDAWMAYMRRTTSTTNYGSELPLAQGIKFDL